MPTPFDTSNMNSSDRMQIQPQTQPQPQPQHITLDLAEFKPSNEFTDLAGETIHNTETSHSLEDIDFIDGHVPRIPKTIPEKTEFDDDDDDDDDRPFSTVPGTGVDDGLLPNGGHDVAERHPKKPPSRRPSFAFPGYNGPGFVEINGVETPIPDVNAYQHKKTLAQGMMDLALLSANANQLRYVLESAGHPYYYPSLIFISISIIFQVAVGVGLILNSRYNIKNEQDICRANKINNYTVIGIFIVTVVNVFISAFGVADN